MQKPKGRPPKVRSIQNIPKITQFSPRGKPGRPDETVLSLDQFEAINLADYRGLDQFEASNILGVSRQSFSRILAQARRKVADALVNGKIIRISGGRVEISKGPGD